jgi:hypothetical protein
MAKLVHIEGQINVKFKMKNKQKGVQTLNVMKYYSRTWANKFRNKITPKTLGIYSHGPPALQVCQKRVVFNFLLQESIFVGYTDNGYRLWNPIKKRESFVARDVVFIENEQFKKNEKALNIWTDLLDFDRDQNEKEVQEIQDEDNEENQRQNQETCPN